MNKKFLAVIKALVLIIIGWVSINTLAFSKDRNTEANSGHELGEIEVGLSVGYAYLKEDKENGFNFHLHIMKRLPGEGVQRYLSIRVGAETIISKEKHYGAMISLAANLWRNLVFSVSPGMEWADHNGKWESKYATHLEVTYILENSSIHYGPAVSYSKARDEQHYTVGIHLGFPF